jgi:tRNA pseudouridine55 synthase
MSKRRGRPVDGILLLDKPVGRSSNAALQAVKRLYQARKAGHTGSLDPLASGLLPICFGEATKVSGFLLDADKDYWVRVRLGVKTATGDAEGEEIARAAVPSLRESEVRSVLDGFLGERQQIPPMHSAVKHQGKRLYELARAGREVERKPRRIRIDEFALEALAADVLDLRVRCSKGTYVRTLAEEIAEQLGTCGHVAALRRLAVGPFACQGMHGMEDLEARAGEGLDALDALLLPIGEALADWPAVVLDADSAFYLGRGQPVQVPQAPTSGRVRVYDQRERLLGVGEVLDDGRIAPKRLLQAS